ncbi:FAD-binding oxidoreductase [uncultured Tateyamaria sp.]|uniref:FAD-binding oxidoreductase n=1 Tax=uncultured Tateyamaria sp. TaxID=455651 RepID=UPI00261C87DF|nr:FAD-binding oxidoreductase [uncultured Tateyamaria sp.]
MLNSLTADRVDAMRAVLPDDRFSEADEGQLQEPRGRYQGTVGLVARPRTTQEVAALVRAASEARVPVIPYGGGTGLVGGQVVPDGPLPLVLSLDRMNAVRDVYRQENVLVAEAGAILTDVQDAAAKVRRLFPLSLASEGSARVGGLLSTNAGGTGVLRYGNARDLCLGIEAVLPSGEIYQGLSRLRKDNTGYDLRHLLIGAEGTLGIITAASLKLFAQPSQMGTALLQVDSPGAALLLLALVREQVGESVSAFELIHRQGFDFLAETMPDLRNPWSETPEWCVLIELGLSGGVTPQSALERIFETGVADGLVVDGMIAQSEAQRADFWSIRESIPEANRRVGSVSSHDISLPLGALADFITEGGKRIAALGLFRINCFGHVGDGNLHYNVFPMPGKTRADHMAEREQIKSIVHDLVHEMSGSVSAEHGIGRLKVGDLERYGDPAKLAAMRAIKAALDPLGIMNPGAVLRA